MAGKNKTKNLLLLVGLVAFVILVAKSNFFGAVVPIESYNGDMEDWCIRPSTATGNGYGNLNGGTVACTDSNSVPYLAPNYDGLSATNEIPLLWAQKYGCCTKRSTDAYEGEYAAQIHKQSTDDWYFFGGWRSGSEDFTVPAIAGRTYTMSIYYKMPTNLFTGDADRKPSIRMAFLDSNYNKISNSEQSRSFATVDQYTRLELTGVAPAGTQHIGWYLQSPPEILFDLFLDNMVIDESDPCSPAGLSEQCGTDIGVCSYGTRTCDTSGNWGTCNGAVYGGREVCENGLDDDCDGEADENCVFDAWTDNEYAATFDTINFATYENTGFSSKNLPTWWAWDNGPIVEAQVDMYLATGDTKYIAQAVTNSLLLIAKAGDGNNDGLLDWENLESPIDPILTYSRTLAPMMRLSYEIQKHGLTLYVDEAFEIQEFVENNFIPVYDDRWAECGSMGFWTESTHSAPNNRASGVERTYLYLYLTTGDEAYYDKVVKYANKIKSTLQTRTDGPSGVPYYYWHYNDQAGCITNDDGTRTCSYICAADQDNYCGPSSTNGWMCTGNLELTYGGYDIQMMVDLHEAGIVFNDEDIQKLANTFKEVFVKPALVDGAPTTVLDWGGPYTAGNGENRYYITAQMGWWPRLGDYDTEVQRFSQQIVQLTIDHNTANNNDYYSRPYLCVDIEDDTYEELCTTVAGEVVDKGRATPATTMAAMAQIIMPQESLEPIDGVVVCTPEWTCTEWSAWSANACGTRTRTCTDTNACGTNAAKPAESETVICEGAACGNGIIETGEACDNNNLNNKECEDFTGFVSGDLDCLPTCAYDTAGCVSEQKTTCTSIWDCTPWQQNVTGKYLRTCTDQANCTPPTNKPLTEVDDLDQEKDHTAVYALVVIGGLVIVYLVLRDNHKRRRR